MRRLFRQFSFPGGISQPCCARDPGSDSRRQAPGCSAVTHAYGAAFDNQAIVSCVIGDVGEAETNRP
jgi:xylulose-5-phosphate/fructose-6-phosphate phosphoketolase